MALEPEDRTENLVGGHRSQFEAQQSVAQMPRKSIEDGRIIVTLKMKVDKDIRSAHGHATDDAVTTLREWVRQYHNNEVLLTDIIEMADSIEITVSK